MQLEEINPKLIHISTDLEPQQHINNWSSSKQINVFAWTYEDMTRLYPQSYQQQSTIKTNAAPIHQHRYRLNLNYATLVKEEIDKLLGLSRGLHNMQ